ncbi:hypothetical protein VTN77DRAFT_3489 [Rasamsonia byssochlamydoides]|uniref:uncharacterized protein n=1 Tax=Rasamsonia byssochlamydoides TaxID=89139 RepID=UPI00374465FD
MALVQYSDSETDAEQDEISTKTPAKKKLRREDPSKTVDHPASLPPLPSNFHDLYASSTRVSVRDDPSLHGGRKRVIPHVEGNWPTHIYLEWYPSRTELNILNGILSHFKANLGDSERQVHSLLQSDLGVQLPLHISLSRPVVLVTEQKQPFSELFERAIEESEIRPFEVKPDGLDWVSNYERTRWFLVVRVKKPENDGLNRLLRISNRSLAAFGQPPLYEEAVTSSQPGRKEKRGARGHKQAEKPSRASESSAVDYSHCFHISIAWCLNEPSPQDKQRVADVDLQPLKALTVSFSSVKVKIGNTVQSMALPTRKIDQGGFSGL